MPPDTALDPDRVAELALRVWQYKQGEVVSLMIHLGDRLGLYRAMTGARQLDAARLASITGLHERWLLEWLRSQAAAGLLESTDGDTFSLTPEASAILADETGSLWFAAGAFTGCVVAPEVVDRLAEAFRTGVGLPYDDLGPSAAHNVERMLAWTRLALVPIILPALDGVVERLRSGGRAVDVGCGAGVAILAMAAAFPDARFEGIDPSHHAITRAKEKLTESGLPNASFSVAAASELPMDPTYDLMLTLDCLHDMPRPEEAVAAIRRAIAPEGTWLIKDIRCASRWEDNLKNPVLAMMYGTSVTTCMSSALSEPGGAGLGTLGLDPGLAERMCREAGFTRFRMLDFDDPANLYYEVRP